VRSALAPRLAAVILAWAASAPADTVVIENVRILPVASAPIERGRILVRGERIEAVGAAAAAPADATRIDGSGLTASPGFIDTFTQIGLVEIAQVPAANDGDEASDPVTPQVRASDAYFLDSDLIPVVRAAGTVALLSAPGPSNVIAGQSALMRTAGETVEEAALRDVAALHLNLGEGPKRAYGERGRGPVTRMATAALVRQAFAQAREYAAKRGPAGRGPVDPRLEPLAAAMAGRIPVVVRAERRADILQGLELAREFGFNMILAGGSDAPQVAAELARRKVPVLIAIDQQPDGIETAGARYENAALLQAAGVKIAFQSNEVTLARNLVPNVGLAVAYGLPPEAALRALTLSAAEIFGVADRIGSLEAGKEATFVLTRGDPLQVRSTVVSTFVRGRRYLPRSYQTLLCETYIKPKGKGIACESQ